MLLFKIDESGKSFCSNPPKDGNDDDVDSDKLVVISSVDARCSFKFEINFIRRSTNFTRSFIRGNICTMSFC